MTPIQQLMLGVGAKKKTYLDDVFSTYLYTGNETARTITNGIDLSGEGGLVWIKQRGGTDRNHFVDTVRGAGKCIFSDATMGEQTLTDRFSGFTSSGFSIGTATDTNKNNTDIASWTFRKSPAFTICEWTGNGTAGRSISHGLKSVPGLIIVKCTSHSSSWVVWHRDFGPTDYLSLNQTQPKYTDEGKFGGFASGSAKPTSTAFTVGVSGDINGSSKTYIAYVLAGGESTAATARSVDFDGTGDNLSLAASTDFQLSGDFTIECWLKVTGTANEGIWSIGNYETLGGFTLYKGADNKVKLYGTNATNTDSRINSPILTHNQYHHVAIVRSGTTVTMYIDGADVGSYTDSGTFGNGSNNTFFIGCSNKSSGVDDIYEGAISNVRVVKGTAVYTSSFRPPTEPLTSITNTTLLCCNNSSTTGKTTGGTITANGDPTASTDSPFDDPAGFVFGESGSENVIKCGSYVGNGSATGPEVNLGFEPQWVMIKNATTADNWVMYDAMRGLGMGDMDEELIANKFDAEDTRDWIDLTSTGFKLTTTDAALNSSDDTFIYICIRRPDGYVGKPAELGTSVFALDTGSGSSTIPSFDSGFPVDMALERKPASDWNGRLGARLMGPDKLITNSTEAESTDNTSTFDSNVGWSSNSSHNSTYQSWMWKRHAGFDVVNYTGNGSTKTVNHSLGRVPEMIWIKDRGVTQNWFVYHNGLNGGTTPWNYHLILNTNGAEGEYSFINQPTTIDFAVTDGWQGSNSNYIAMLFASVDGISKVGYYAGTGSATTITTGFQPRFAIIKNITAGNHWYVLDTTRGWGSGDDKYLKLDDTAAQGTFDFGAPTSTGFTLASGDGAYNASSNNYIYYAHA